METIVIATALVAVFYIAFHLARRTVFCLLAGACDALASVLSILRLFTRRPPACHSIVRPTAL